MNSAPGRSQAGEGELVGSIAGDVARTRVIINVFREGEAPEDSSELLIEPPSPTSISEAEGELQSALRRPYQREVLSSRLGDEVRRYLGESFYARVEAVREGKSIELLVVIGTVYTVVTRYSDFVQALRGAVEGTRSLVAELLSPWAADRDVDVRVSASWAPGPAFRQLLSTPVQSASAAADARARAPLDPRRYPVMGGITLLFLVAAAGVAVAVAYAIKGLL